MDIKKQLREEFSQIIDVYFEVEDNQKFLRVKTSLTSLKAIEKLTEQISRFLDQQKFIETQYYLDVFSPGAELDEKELETLK